jgi:hypothetical protein
MVISSEEPYSLKHAAQAFDFGILKWSDRGTDQVTFEPAE